MFQLRRALTALPILALALPAAADAQEPDPQVQQVMAELQQINAQLMPLQERAMEDEALSSEREATTQALRAAMIEADPQVGASLDRMDAMLDEVRQAQEAGDADRIVALTQEAQQLQPRIAMAQQQALEREDIQDRIEAFQTNLRNRMIELEPAAARLFERADELQEQLNGGG
ncbi:MAG TPA: hypothetical protein VK929_09190 [Longimicrobiales bacterium]|nr:hypothetical protein [Longimicrobiales bacterium]